MLRFARFTAVALLASAVLADEAIQYNLVSLQAEARREVSNDLAQASLYVEFSDSNAALLSDKLNRALADALKTAAVYPKVRAANGGNSVFPLYGRSNKAEGWRGRADIRLESADFKSLAELIGKLQSTMQLGGMSFSVSPASMEQTETALIDDAVKAFRGRADVVRRSLGGKSYKLVNLSVNTQGGFSQPPIMRAKIGLMRAEAADVSAPPMEGGQSQVTVSVNGTIQID